MAGAVYSYGNRETIGKAARIPSLCRRRAEIDLFEAGEDGATIRFRNDRVPNPDGLIAYLKSQDGLARVRNKRLVVKRDWSKQGDRVKGAVVVCRDVAKAIMRPETVTDVAA